MDPIWLRQFGRHENQLGLSLLGFLRAHEFCAFACARPDWRSASVQIGRLRREFLGIRDIALNAASPDCEDDDLVGYDIADVQIFSAKLIRQKVSGILQLMQTPPYGRCTFPNDIREIVGEAEEVFQEDVFRWIVGKAGGMSRSFADLLDYRACSEMARGIRQGTRYIEKLHHTYHHGLEWVLVPQFHDGESSYQSFSMPTSMSSERGRRGEGDGGNGGGGEAVEAGTWNGEILKLRVRRARQALVPSLMGKVPVKTSLLGE